MIIEVAIYLGLFISGMVFGAGFVRYGLGLGSKLHIRAKNDMSLNEDVKSIDQDFTE
jgi:hypothetical protein